jgi:type II secretory pathway pseudopilin PulG
MENQVLKPRCGSSRMVGLATRMAVASETAFTVIELLVVLAMIGLLASTLLPALGKSRPTSQAFQCLNNNRQLCLAWRMYADDNHDQIVYSSDDGTGTANPLNQYAWTLTHLDLSPQNRPNWDTNLDIVQRPLWPYTGKNALIYRCPADKSFVMVNGARTPRVRSMSMNFYLGGFAGTTGGLPSIDTYRLFLKTTALTAPGPAKTFVFLEERWDAINWGNFLTDMAGYPNQPSLYAFQEDYPNMIHDLACSFSFADGRAEMHRWKDARTTPPFAPYFPNFVTASPRNPDIAWLQDHATRPKNSAPQPAPSQ